MPDNNPQNGFSFKREIILFLSFSIVWLLFRALGV